MPPPAAWPCPSLWPTPATSPVSGSALTPQWSFTHPRWSSPSPDPSSAPSLSRAWWDLRESPKSEPALGAALVAVLGALLVLPEPLELPKFMVGPGGPGGTRLGAADPAAKAGRERAAGRGSTDEPRGLQGEPSVWGTLQSSCGCLNASEIPFHPSPNPS